MQSLIRATDIVQVLDHLRALTSQLRAQRIALDYAQLALDLRRVQRPDGPQKVRTHWARDFYRAPARLTELDDSATATTPGDPS